MAKIGANLSQNKGRTTPPKAAVNEQEQPGEVLAKGMVEIIDLIAPPALEVDFNHIKIGNTYYRTLFVSGYPRFVGANWLSPIINFEHSLHISMFYYPVESKGVLDDLRRKIGEMEATLKTEQEQGKAIDPAIVAALEDAKKLQEQMVKGIEKFFQFSLYITIPATNPEELERITKKVESTLGSIMVISKKTTLQMEAGFQTCLPLGLDKLIISRNMDTTSLASTFPFTSSELTANEGILYGINQHNGSLVIFDRFALENANSVIFAKSGAGKSYLVKLEALRYLMFGSEIIVVDPEAEYKVLCDSIGGDYVNFSQESPSKINPFDLAAYGQDKNTLGSKIMSLHTLFKIMLGGLSPTEEAVLDKALISTYKDKGISPDPRTQDKTPPVMGDLYHTLRQIKDPVAQNLAEKLERYVSGSLSGIIDQQSTVDITNTFTVFSTRDLEDSIRPVAIFIILDFIWTKVRNKMRKRLLIVDEAWYLMQYPDSALFMYAIAKRARKYYLGLTTISQDVEDFLSSDYGRAIVTNSSIQILLKQSPAAIDLIQRTFYLSEGEKRLLLSANIGEGLFFAGSNHVAIKITASPEEHELITTSPKEIMERKQREEQKAPFPNQPKGQSPQPNTKQVSKPTVQAVAKEQPRVTKPPVRQDGPKPSSADTRDNRSKDITPSKNNPPSTENYSFSQELEELKKQAQAEAFKERPQLIPKQNTENDKSKKRQDKQTTNGQIPTPLKTSEPNRSTPKKEGDT